MGRLFYFQAPFGAQLLLEGMESWEEETGFFYLYVSCNRLDEEKSTLHERADNTKN